jgi:ubiquinone/menaquinone biosynthesis C-methylase UbiE
MHPSTFISRLANSILIIFFKLLYHSFAWTYDWVAWIVSLGNWREWVLSTLPDLPGPTILEIGHGPGHLQKALALAGRHAIGLDESRQMGSMARRRLLRSNQRPRLVRGRAQSLPFATGIFQQVVATFPTNYIFDPQTLAEIYRVLRSDGNLVVIPVAWLTANNWPSRIMAKFVHISGQAPEWNERFLEPLLQAGFKASTERRNLTSSQLIVVLARKNQ